MNMSFTNFASTQGGETWLHMLCACFAKRQIPLQAAIGMYQMDYRNIRNH